MKYRLLLPAFILIASLPARAQRFSFSSGAPTEASAAPEKVQASELPETMATHASPIRGPQAKGAGATIYSQTFPSLPAGWAVSTNSNSFNGWRWANAAPSGTGNNYPINGLINSTTKGNGWLLYNADSVISTRTNATLPFGGAITSTAIPIGAGHPNVMLSFQQYFRYSTGDSCFVDVSSNGTTWTAFPVFPNMSLSQYGFLYRNPTVTTFNISSVVGGQANAYIRFRFNSTAPTYSFNWLIDDLMLYDADPVDLGITYSGIVSASDTNSSFSRSYGYTSIPLQFADSVYPVTTVSNYGLAANAGTTITARYFQGNNLVSTQTMNTGASPLGARDSIVVFGTGYKPTTAGDYTVALMINPSGDPALENNVDTIRFSVTDTAYASCGANFTERNCYLNHQGTSQFWGARFSISNSHRDTITSVSAAFRPVTVAGQQVQAQLYQATGSGVTYSWIPLAVSATRTLSTADISTSSNVVMTTFPFLISGHNYGPLILGDGDYAVVLTTVNASSDVAVYSMVPPLPIAPSFIGYQGQSATSGNDGHADFSSAGGIATGLVEVPLVRANFGNARALLAVPKTEPIILGVAFPNPANTSINIPVGLQQTGAAQVSLTNVAGQVVSRLDLGRMHVGVMQLATVPTGALPEGLYFYNVSADGGRAAGSVMIKH